MIKKNLNPLFIVLWLFLGFLPSFGQQPCSSYLQHYWKLEENNLSVFQDSAGSLDASATVIPTRVTGIVGYGQSFNGLAEVDIPDNGSFDWDANSSFTIEFWMNKSTSCPSASTSNNNVIIGRDDPASQLHWWAGVSCTNPGRINFNLVANNGVGTNIESNQGVIDGAWHHIVIVRDGTAGTTSLFIDGQLDITASFVYTDGFASAIGINVGWLNLSEGFHYSGMLDELALYNRAINLSEIQEHYNTGIGISYCSQTPTAETIIKILPLGNSITYDNHSEDLRPVGERTGYRIHLYNELLSAGYNFDFVGSEIAGQDLFPDPENGGFPGITKEQLVTLLQSGYNPRTSTQVTNGPYLDFIQPDVILLHIGTNGLTSDINAINQILDLIDTYRNQSGKMVKLLIARIINRQVYSALNTQYNINLENAFSLRNHPDNYIVDMENGAGIDYLNDMIDNLHPTDMGYQKMAGLWYSALTGILEAPSGQPNFIKAPSDLTTNPLQEAVSLSWKDNASNETGYKIERKSGSGSFVEIIQLPANTISYIDLGLQVSTEYTYRIFAFNNVENSVYSNESIVQTPASSASVDNIAPGKPVIQSSTYFGGIAERAIDNNTSGKWSSNSVTHTTDEQSPYWQIDLQASYNIDHIEVWNRTDICCRARLSNFYIFVSDVPFTSFDLNTTLTQAGVWNSFNANYPDPSATIAVNRTGRYVRLQLANQGAINLAEFKVYANALLKTTKSTIPDYPRNEPIQFSVFPNPFSDELNIQFNLIHETTGYLAMLDLTGKEIKSISLGLLQPGTNLFTWDVQLTDGLKVNPGVYLIKLVLNNSVYFSKVVFDP